MKLIQSANIAIVYLARRAEGLEPAARFLASYRRHPAGEPHDLVLVMKGFASGDAETQQIVDMFSGFVERTITIDDSGVDITAYLYAASVLPHKTLCFLNTFSVILASGWLSKLASHLQRDGVGMVGGSGSYESLRTSLHLLSKVVWLCASAEIAYDWQIVRYYRWLLQVQHPSWLSRTRSERLRALLQIRRSYSKFDAAYELHWEAVTQPGGPIGWVREYPEFPNPHLRTNAFMIDKKLLLSFNFPKITEKTESCAFESGHESLTARIRRLGLSVLIVARDGDSYEVQDWPSSRTFRLGGQENLLVADNQTLNFARHSRTERDVHVVLSWGDYCKLSKRVPMLGVRMDRKDI